MKKTVFSIIGVAVIGAAIGLNINKVLSGSSSHGDLLLVNAEALAQWEVEVWCHRDGGQCWIYDKAWQCCDWMGVTSYFCSPGGHGLCN